jgi:hypothetical protein
MVTLCKWPSGAPDGHLQGVTIPDAVLIYFDLLMMGTTLLHACRMGELCVRLAICRSYTKMHGQQNFINFSVEHIKISV